MVIEFVLLMLFNFARGDMYIIKYPIPDSIRGHAYMPLDTVFVEDSFTLMSVILGHLTHNKSFKQDSQIINYLRNVYASILKEPAQIIIQHFIRISIIGEVKQPVLTYVNIKSPVSNVLSIAGGPTEKANLKKLKVYTKGGYIKLNFYDATKRALTFEDIGLSSGDVIEVPQKLHINFTNISAAISAIILIWSFYQTNFR